MYGTHYKEPPTRTPFCELFQEALFGDFMLRVLMVASVLTIASSYATHEEGDPPPLLDGGTIMIAVAIVSLVGSVSDYKKEGEFVKKTTHGRSW